MPNDLLSLSREIKGIAEAGLRYAESPYDLERYRRLHQVAGELVSAELPGFKWPEELGYNTPKVDTRAAVIHDGRILMVREEANGLWTLPGGWADVEVTPAENAVREVKEETGYDVEATKLLACWDKERQGHPRQAEYLYKLVFGCRLIGGEMQLSHEILEIDWFAPDALPEMCPYRAAPHYIELAFRHQDDPSLPTEFD